MATAPSVMCVRGQSNAAPEWQAERSGRNKELAVACPLEGLVGWLFTLNYALCLLAPLQHCQGMDRYGLHRYPLRRANPTAPKPDLNQ